MFDSPFEYCIVCRAYVLLDQTCRECAREHGCAGPCPLQPFFTGVEVAAASAHTHVHVAAKRPRQSPS